MAGAMSSILAGEAHPQERALFRERWRARVRRILVEHADDHKLVSIVPRH